MQKLALLLLSLSLAACSSSPSAPAPQTDDDAGNTTDMSQDAGDMSATDAGECVPETAEEFCERIEAECSEVEGIDNCGESRTFDCGGCDEGLECTESNTCQAPANPEACEAVSAECGTIDVEGSPAFCGECAEGSECVENTCACVGVDEATICNDAGANCGTVEYTNCLGEPVDIACGQCDPEADEVCNDNVCTCVPESNEAFCSRVEQCGNVTAEDNCGSMRTADCGCAGEELCVPSADVNTSGSVCCLPQTDGELCTVLNSDPNNCQTNYEDASDNCGQMRTVECSCACSFDPVATCQGRCGDVVLDDGCVANCGDNCNANQVCSATNECCTPNNNSTAFCQGKCGTVDFTNNCGETIQVDCGGCGFLQACVSNECRGL